MQFILSTLALLASAAVANPIIYPRQANNTTKTFQLKTSDATNPEHNDLYVSAYHTGAGFNDAVLSAADSASSGFLNGSYVQFDLNTPFPWGFAMGANTYYAAWLPVQINAGSGTEGFFVNGTGLQWSEQNGFGGWLVCDWYHSVPQLFWLYKYYTPTIPSSCSKVNLQVEYES